METTKATPQGFIDYINGQDPSKLLSHHQWGDCAFGQYLDSIGDNLLDIRNALYGNSEDPIAAIDAILSQIRVEQNMANNLRVMLMDTGFTKEMLSEPESDPTTLHAVLNLKSITKVCNLDTYDDLQKFIKDNCYIVDNVTITLNAPIREITIEGTIK